MFVQRRTGEPTEVRVECAPGAVWLVGGGVAGAVAAARAAQRHLAVRAVVAGRAVHAVVLARHVLEASRWANLRLTFAYKQVQLQL